MCRAGGVEALRVLLMAQRFVHGAIFLAACLSLIAAAPTLVKNSEKEEHPLVRTKRADENIVNEHASEIHDLTHSVKKRDLTQDVSGDVTQDNSDVSDGKTGETSSGEVKTNDAEAAWSALAEDSREGGEEEEEKGEDISTDNASWPNEVAVGEEMEQQAGEDGAIANGLQGSQENEVTPDDDSVNDDHLERDSDDSFASKLTDSEDDEDMPLDENYRRKRSVDAAAPAPASLTGRDTQRQKRAAGTMLTAEKMGETSEGAGSARSMRTKRDLSYDEVRELLEDRGREEGEGENDEQYYDVNDDDDDNVIETNKRGEVDEEAFLGLSAEEQEEKEERERVEDEIVRIRYELVQNLMKEKEKEEAKEAVLDYLIEAAEERAEAAERARELERESEKEAEREALLSYYPTARTAAKRYPYSYEPYGGRWGAVVPGAKRSAAREAAAYARLYRLAQALNENEAAEEAVREREVENEDGEGEDEVVRK